MLINIYNNSFKFTLHCIISIHCNLSTDSKSLALYNAQNGTYFFIPKVSYTPFKCVWRAKN